MREIFLWCVRRKIQVVCMFRFSVIEMIGLNFYQVNLILLGLRESLLHQKLKDYENY
jgi:hypothetical protein